MFKFLINLFIATILIVTTVAPVFISAQSGPAPSPTEGPAPSSNIPRTNIEIQNPFKQNTIRGFIETVIKDILIPIGSVVAVLMIMYAGFLYVTGRGNPAQIQKAHQALLWAVIGAAILLGAWVISDAIQSTIDDLRK